MGAALRHFLAFATALVLAFPLTAIAALSYEDSWSAQSSEGLYLLVMRQSNSEFVNPANKEGAELEKKYSQSGVYIRGDFQDSLFWALPYQPPVYEAYLSRNGEHLLLAISAGHTSSNVPPWGSLHFFHKNGAPQHWLEYEFTWGFLVKELLYIYPRRSWSEWTDAAFDSTANTFRVKTNRAEEFVFDITTGRKIHTKSDWNLWSIIFLVCVPAVIFGSRRIAGRKSQLGASSTFWRLSVAEALLLIALAAVLLALARFSAVVSIAVLLVGLGGGAIAQLVARGRRSWWMGGLGAVYGSVVGLILFSLLVEPMLWRMSWLNGEITIAAIFGLFAIGGMIGALVGGMFAKERRRVACAPDAVGPL